MTSRMRRVFTQLYNKLSACLTTAIPPVTPPPTAKMPLTNGESIGSSAEISDFYECDYLHSHLTVFVVGASGDLAKKKTYPSLFSLYVAGYLPENVIICGYARSKKSDEEFREGMRKSLKHDDNAVISRFLGCCIYRNGQYDDAPRVSEVFGEISEMESSTNSTSWNRLFYFAIPPNLFVTIGRALKEVAMSDNGWNRFIIEKPFGRDLDSFEALHSDISGLLTEKETFRIDHYIGKEMVQNLMVMRFANSTFEPLWNRNHISSVTITFKENFGTAGRGGYFDKYGIVRDVMQNHLMQILCMVAMEPPVQVSGDYIRDEKVKVLQCIDEIRTEDCITGQYTAYTDDDGVPDDSQTPTFAALVMYVRNARWEGVPFILRAGKALNERKSEVRVQFKAAPGGARLFDGDLPRNELVMRVHPNEAMYLKTLVKQPGLAGRPVVTELDLSYKRRFADKFSSLPDAYTRLILQVLRGDASAFVRDDELRESWRIFTPLLHAIDNGEILPDLYRFGTRGPRDGDKFTGKLGYVYSGKEYSWNEKS